MGPMALAGLSLPFSKLKFMPGKAEGKRIGIIGLDTSHSVAFTKSLNASIQNPIYDGFRIVAAYPQGSKDIVSSTERIPGYTEDVKKLGVEIVGSIQELLHKVDFVLLETNDGRLHLEQAIEVFKAGKTTFIDKPIAASLADAKAIFNEAEKYKVPIFSASSLRFSTGMQEIRQGKIGPVVGADTYSPMKFEKLILIFFGTEFMALKCYLPSWELVVFRSKELYQKNKKFVRAFGRMEESVHLEG